MGIETVYIIGYKGLEENKLTVRNYEFFGGNSLQ